MADSKRRRNRVQGSWAASSASSLSSSSSANEDSRRRQQESPSSLEVATSRPLESQPKFVYKETKQVYRQKPAAIFIDNEGRYVLSNTPDKKTCSISFYPDFVRNKDERKEIFEILRQNIPWEEKSCLINGERISMPRLLAWYGPMAYHFSGATLPQNEEWPPVIRVLHDRIKDATGYEFNSVLLNLYRNGKDSVAWHSDDELLLGIHPVIASLSFGETRIFELREKASELNYEFSQLVKVPLKDGSLLVMEGETQTYWQHRIPKEFHDRKARINLTFRTVFKKD